MNWFAMTEAAVLSHMPTDVLPLYNAWIITNPTRTARLSEITTAYDSENGDQTYTIGKAGVYLLEYGGKLTALGDSAAAEILVSLNGTPYFSMSASATVPQNGVYSTRKIPYTFAEDDVLTIRGYTTDGTGFTEPVLILSWLGPAP